MSPHLDPRDSWCAELETGDVVKAILAATTDLALLINEDQTIVAANEPMAKSLGVPLDELVGGDVRGFLTPAKYDQRTAYVQLAVERREAVEFEDTRDGRMFVTRIVPIESPSGLCSHVAVFSRDVTQERLTRATLRESENLYQALIESLPQGVFYKDRSLTYVACNTRYAHDLSRSPDEVVGKTDFDLFSRDIAEAYRASDRQILETGTDREIDQGSLDPSERGGKVHRFVKAPVRDENREIVGILGIYWDITDRKRAEQQQERYNEIQKRMTVLVAHELKTPLTAIAGYADLLGGQNPDGNEPLAGIRRNVHRLGQLIDSFLDLERIEARSLSLERSQFRVIEMLRSLINQHTFMSRRKNLQVDATADKDLMLYGDRDLLGRAFSNILSNAIRFTDQGYVRMTAAQSDSEVILTTSDTGCGIEPAALPHIFDRFFHADPDPAMEEDGALTRGLGLTLAKTIIEEHGGRIDIESHPGDGTVVTVSLPRFSSS